MIKHTLLTFPYIYYQPKYNLEVKGKENSKFSDRSYCLHSEKKITRRNSNKISGNEKNNYSVFEQCFVLLSNCFASVLSWLIV